MNSFVALYYRLRGRRGEASSRIRVVAVMLGAVWLLTACSLPIAMIKENDAEVTTGSILSPGSKISNPTASLPAQLNDEDWRRAKSALALAVDPQGNGAPVNWDNPASGRKGSFVAKGQLFVSNDEVCREFVAAVEDKGQDKKIQGNSCRQGPNDWFIRDSKLMMASHPVMPPKKAVATVRAPTKIIHPKVVAKATKSAGKPGKRMAGNTRIDKMAANTLAAIH